MQHFKKDCSMYKYYSEKVFDSLKNTLFLNNPASIILSFLHHLLQQNWTFILVRTENRNKHQNS